MCVTLIIILPTYPATYTYTYKYNIYPYDGVYDRSPVLFFHAFMDGLPPPPRPVNRRRKKEEEKTGGGD